MNCTRCFGLSRSSCPTCNGSGHQYFAGGGAHSTGWETCSSCSGTGYRPCSCLSGRVVCPSCGGSANSFTGSAGDTSRDSGWSASRSDLTGSIGGFLAMVALVGMIWGWLTIGPAVKNFFNRHYTDPATATWLGKDEFAHRNYAEARFWFDVGATHGNSEAQFDLGLMYARGVGGPANRAEATMWIKKAAGGGYRPAKEWLAKNGMKQDKSH